MSDILRSGDKKNESLFLSERFMAAACILVVVTCLASVILCVRSGDTFAAFEWVIKLGTAVAMYLAFRYYKWDVAKGLMGGMLFCLMYQEAYLVLGRLWSEQDFDIYLVTGIQGSIYTINHFFINYASHGNPKDVILNRIAILFKFAVYILLFVANSRLGFSAGMLWKNAVGYLSDIALLLLLVTIESQFDSFKAIRRELLKLKREGGKSK